MTTRAKWMRALIVAALAALLVGRWLAVTTTDRLWADALGVGEPLGSIARLRLSLLIVVFAVALAWSMANLYLVYRSIGSVQVPRQLGNLEIHEAMPRRYLGVAAAAIGLIIAIALSHGADDWWYARLLNSMNVEEDLREPILGRDVAFYLFRLPWQRTLHSFVTLACGTLLAVTAALYAAVGAIRWVNRSFRVMDLARAHLAVLLALFGLALFWGYRLEPLEYVGGIHGVAFDSVLLNVRLPVARLLSSLALIVVGVSLLWLWTPRAVLVIAAWGALAVVSAIGHYAVPAFATSVRTAEERRLEHVEATKKDFRSVAYGIPGQEVEANVVAGPEPGAFEPYTREAASGPIWDEFAVDAMLDRLSRGSATRYSAASLTALPDSVTAPRLLFLATRLPDHAAVRRSGGDLSWVNRHTGVHATGRGVVAVSATRVSPSGHPMFLIDQADPDSITSEATDLAGSQRHIISGPGMRDFAVFGNDQRQVIGVEAGGLLRRVALAWALQSPRLVTSTVVSRSAKVVWHREVVERLERVAPFADFGAPYPVLVDQRVYWIAAGYTTAEAFPLSAQARWRGERVRYFRSGLVGVVDAHSGRASVYLSPQPDPLSREWRELMPEVVRAADQFPRRLRELLRYPEELFAIQAGIIREQGFSTNLRPTPSVLLQRVGALSVDEFERYWWVGTIGDDTVVRLRRRVVFEEGEPPALRGYADGAMEDGVAALRVFRVTDVDVAGPSRLAASFRRARGTQDAVPGPIKAVPLADGVLYVQSAYGITDAGDTAPELTDVVVAWGPVVERGRTLLEALSRVRAATWPPAVAAAQWAEVRRWFERLDEARRRGDWQAFGQAYEALRALLMTQGDSTR